jgi:alkanesulfonate monooxygenase SsuD/methylene tetrahydromethanopterin reductase-like flavin-dependent oxidoreductase (luciferase family)
MAELGREHGCLSALISEHHTSPDGYIPSPLILASAIAARTTNLPIVVARCCSTSTIRSRSPRT